MGESSLLHSAEEVEAFVRTRPACLLKEPWSGCGRGIRHAAGTFPPSLRGWTERVLRTQQAIVGEPFYDKVADFAMEFAKGDGRGVRFTGYSVFETDERGAYKGNLLATNEALERRLTAYVPQSVLHALRDKLSATLSQVIGNDYQGCLGVDMMVCLSADGKGYVIHPCVEVNLRMSMGMVARQVYDRHVQEGTCGKYVVEYYPEPGEAERTHRRLCREHPLRTANGRILSGYLSLTPVNEDTAYQAYLVVDENA